MSYYINVSREGFHFFTTDRKIAPTVKEEARELLREIQKRFPKEEGWEVKAYRQRAASVDVTEDLTA